MSGVNPQGCDVHSFKSPSPEELNRDYLWRNHKVIPERGKIGIFNRSYYEEVLVVHVHPTFLRAQKLPDRLVTKHIWEERYEDINAFERYLTRNGVVIRKFFLHVSKEEQKQRFLERLEDSKKNWKFSMENFQFFFESSRRSRKRCFCSSLETCRKNLRITTPLRVR